MQARAEAFEWLYRYFVFKNTDPSDPTVDIDHGITATSASTDSVVRILNPLKEYGRVVGIKDLEELTRTIYEDSPPKFDHGRAVGVGAWHGKTLVLECPGANIGIDTEFAKSASAGNGIWVSATATTEAMYLLLKSLDGSPPTMADIVAHDVSGPDEAALIGAINRAVGIDNSRDLFSGVHLAYQAAFAAFSELAEIPVTPDLMDTIDLRVFTINVPRHAEWVD